MTKIIQISTINVEDAEPFTLGLGENGGVYQWNIKTATWTLWGVNPSNREDFQPQD